MFVGCSDCCSGMHAASTPMHAGAEARVNIPKTSMIQQSLLCKCIDCSRSLCAGVVAAQWH